MRIITGSARGRNLITLQGEATRPTAERTKEAVFSKIQFDIEGRRVLDLFAGSGQMGLEALSRGAASAVLVDRAREATEVIRKNATNTKLEDKCTVICADALSYLDRERVGFDIVFLDPPYATSLVKAALEKLTAKGLLKTGSLVVCESGKEDVFEGDESLRAKFDVIKQTKYGIAHVTILTPGSEGGKDEI